MVILYLCVLTMAELDTMTMSELDLMELCMEGAEVLASHAASYLLIGPM